MLKLKCFCLKFDLKTSEVRLFSKNLVLKVVINSLEKSGKRSAGLARECYCGQYMDIYTTRAKYRVFTRLSNVMSSLVNKNISAVTRQGRQKDVVKKNTAIVSRSIMNKWTALNQRWCNERMRMEEIQFNRDNALTAVGHMMKTIRGKV